MPKKAGAQPNQSLIDGIAVLQAIAVSNEPIGCRDVSLLLGMENTRVNRLLKTLNFLGLADQTTNRKYIAGPGINVLAAQSLFASGLLRSAIAPMEQLQSFGRVVALGVLWRDSVSFLYHAQPGMASGEAIGRIGLYPATQSGVGMALLSEYTEDQVRAIYEDKDIPGFPDGISALLLALKEIKNNGYARIEITSSVSSNLIIPDQPHYTVAVSIGSPVSSALGLSGWIPETSVQDVVKALKAAKTEIETTGITTHSHQLIATLSERFKEHTPK